MKKKLSKKTQEKIIQFLDDAFEFDIIDVLYNFFFLFIYSLFIMLLSIGIKEKLFEGYFEFMIIGIFIVILCEKIFVIIKNLDERWKILGLGIFLGNLLLIYNRISILIVVLDCCVIIIIFATIYQKFKTKIIEFLNTVKFNK